MTNTSVVHLSEQGSDGSLSVLKITKKTENDVLCLSQCESPVYCRSGGGLYQSVLRDLSSHVLKVQI